MAGPEAYDPSDKNDPNFALAVISITHILDEAERSGRPLSKQVRTIIEDRCGQLFDYRYNTAEAVVFSQTIKIIAVRLFRQQRYREADARYRLASRFNPGDPTLISNRATCMYNLSRYKACIALCNECLSDFVDLFHEKPRLYLKILNRLGQAHIELNNFKEASTIYQALCKLRDCNLDVPDKEFRQLLMQYDKHLNARAGKYAILSMASKEHYLEHYEEDTDDEENGEDPNTLMQLHHLCCHVHEFGESECRHAYPDAKFFGTRDGKKNCDKPRSENSLRHLLIRNGESESTGSSDGESQIGDDVSGSSAHRGELESNKSDRVISDDEQKGTLTSLEVISKTDLNQRSTLVSGKKLLPATAKKSGIDWTRAWKQPEAAEKKGISSDSGSASASPAKIARNGFRRGFLDKEPLPSIPISELHARVAAKISKKMEAACYESDEEVGPLGSGIIMERMDEDDEVQALREKLPMSATTLSHDLSLAALLDELLGKSFRFTRTVELSKLFGQHEIANSGGKRKKRSCDINCGPCFARRMWNERFISSDQDEAKSLLPAMDKDPRRDDSTYLPRKQWQRTGYYGSGYELAYDLFAVIHGVAYACLLQAELYWRSDKLSFQRDMQNKFITAISDTYKRHSNLDFIFMIYYVVRDTVTLFEVFPDFAKKGLPLSFQFSNRSENIAKRLQSNGADGSESTRNQTILTMKTNDLARNMHSWAVLGQLAKDEKWVYNIMLRDLSHLLIRLTSKVKRLPSYLQGANTFSEAFEKACNQRTDSEKYWKVRIVTIIARERSRFIERDGFAAKSAKEYDRCERLYSYCIDMRPNQPRLYLRRAQGYAEQEKWQEALEDAKKSFALVTKDEALVASHTCKTPHNCMLLDLHLLEGDVLAKLSECSNQTESINYAKAAAKSYRKAQQFNINSDPVSKVLKMKLRIAEEHWMGIGAASRSASKHSKMLDAMDLKQDSSSEHSKKARSSKSKRKKTKRGQAGSRQPAEDDKSPGQNNPSQLVTVEQKPNDSSSDEEEEEEEETVVPLTNSRFGVLLDSTNPDTPGTQPKSTPQPKPEVQLENPPQEPGALDWETVGKRPARPTQRKGFQAAAGSQARNVTNASSSSSRPSPSGVIYNCRLCNLYFGSRDEYDRHIRERRHRSNFTPPRTYEPVQNRRAQNRTETVVNGPTLEEAATEMERAMVILGGEARPIDVIAKMNFSRWGIQNVNAYLSRQFGGLLQLCRQKPNTFQLVTGASGRVMILLVDRTGFMPLSQRRESLAAHQAARERAQQQSRKIDVQELLRQQLYVPQAEESREPEKYEEEECKICMDSKVDTMIIPCGHKWCDDCIMANMQRDRYTCPFCQQPIQKLQHLNPDD